MSNLRANQASDALIQYEAAQELVEMHQMTDSGDAQTFEADESPWSDVAGFEPKIKPNGLATGGVITPATGDDKVAVSSATCWLAGVETAVSSAELAHVDGLERPGSDEYVTHSIIITAGGVFDVQPGTPTTDQGGFSTTRGAAGGPPEIPVDAIEVGWVRMTGTSAPVESGDIRQVPGVTTERYDFPLWSENFVSGAITFFSALPKIHVDEKPKKVFCEVYTPTFADLEPASDFVPPETSHSQTSTEVYGGAIGASSSTLDQGSFTVFLRDGVTDPIVALKNQKLWFRFYPHRLRAPHMLAQGTLGISRTFPAGDSIQAECTLTADGPAVEMAE